MQAPSNKRHRKASTFHRTATAMKPPLLASTASQMETLESRNGSAFPPYAFPVYGDTRKCFAYTADGNAPHQSNDSRGLMPRFSSNPIPYERQFDNLPPRQYRDHNAPFNSSTSWHCYPASPLTLCRLPVQHTTNRESESFIHQYSSFGHNNTQSTSTICLQQTTNSESESFIHQSSFGPNKNQSMSTLCHDRHKESNSNITSSQSYSQRKYDPLDKYQTNNMHTCDECYKRKFLQYRSVGTMTCEMEDPLDVFATNMFNPPVITTDAPPIEHASIDFRVGDADRETPCSLNNILLSFDETIYSQLNGGHSGTLFSKGDSPENEEDWSASSLPPNSVCSFAKSLTKNHRNIALQITDTISSSEDTDKHDEDWTSPSNSVAYSEVTGGSRLSPDKAKRRLRPRRVCSVQDCGNRVVQGGLCISHGAKRKPCGYQNCSKFVKHAGMCSAHGPRRKRCLMEDCDKAAVQNGTCIFHGAKKKLCLMEGCDRQGVIKGVCKRHRAELQNSV